MEAIGFGGGDGNGSAPRDDERERRSDSQSQDLRNRVQILDAGELTNAQRRELVEERHRLVDR